MLDNFKILNAKKFQYFTMKVSDFIGNRTGNQRKPQEIGYKGLRFF